MSELEGRMPYLHGEVCQHGSIKRKCDICWLQWERDEWQKACVAGRK
jgi:hypothetical protein